MGTVYRSLCGCLVSAPEPDQRDESEHTAWAAFWDRRLRMHTKLARRALAKHDGDELSPALAAEWERCASCSD